jgi:hypothetical protein
MNIISIIFSLAYVPAEMPPLWLMVVIGIVFIFSMGLIAANLRQENVPAKEKF